jgi:hypothetical protein
MNLELFERLFVVRHEEVLGKTDSGRRRLAVLSRPKQRVTGTK